jgi:hypothetical protein
MPVVDDLRLGLELFGIDVPGNEIIIVVVGHRLVVVIITSSWSLM